MKPITFTADGMEWRMRIPRPSELVRAGLKPLTLIPPPGGDRDVPGDGLPPHLADLLEQAESLTIASLTGVRAEGSEAWKDLTVTPDDGASDPERGVIYVADIPGEVQAALMQHLSAARQEATRALKSFCG